MNRSELRTAIQARGWYTDTVTEQNTLIASAVREIENLEWWSWRKVAGTGAVTVAGTSTVAVPTNLSLLTNVRLAFGTDYIPELAQLPSEEIRALLHEDRDRGEPLYWSRFGANIVLYPTPDKVYTVTTDGYAWAKVMDDDADVPTIPVDLQDIVVHWVVRELAWRERDFNAADRAQVMVDKYLVKMREHDSDHDNLPTSVVDNEARHGRFDQYWLGW